MEQEPLSSLEKRRWDLQHQFNESTSEALKAHVKLFEKLAGHIENQKKTIVALQITIVALLLSAALTSIFVAIHITDNEKHYPPFHIDMYHEVPLPDGDHQKGDS